jgi:hypothetical protein
MEQSVRQQVAFYGSTPSYGALLRHHGFNDLGRELNTLMRTGDLAAMAKAVPDALIEEVAIICKPHDLGRELRRRYDGLLDRVSLYMAMSGSSGFNRWDELIAAVHAA